MRKKYLKIFSLLIVGMLTLQLNAEVVSAVPADSITVDITNPGTESYATGLLETHNMSVSINGQKYRAYCAWYEKDAPISQKGLTGAQVFTKMSLNDDVAAGLATIVNTNIKAKYRDLSDDEVIAIQTAAVNLFLSKKTGINRFDNITWVSGIFSVYSKNFKNLLDTFKSQYDAFTKNWNTCADNINGLGGKYKSCRNQAAAYYLYNLGMTTATNVQNASLIFTESSSKTLTYNNGYYVGTFSVKSNVPLQTQEASLDYKITGVTDKSQIIVTKNIAGTIGSLTLKIPESVVQGNESNVEVTVTAKTTYNKSVVYILNDSLRKQYQDLLFVNYEEVPVIVSTDAKIIPQEQHCFKYTTDCDDTKCDNTNSSNIRTCYSKIDDYYSATCDTSDALNKASGKYTTTLKAGVCSLYCTESAKVYYPGNVRPAITIGTNLEWPTSASGEYPLQTLSTLTCTIEMDNEVPVTQECINLASQVKYVTGDNSAYVLYNDTKEDQRVDLKQDCSSTTNVNGSNVTITNSCFYTLDNTYNAINKETLEFVKNESIKASEAVTNYYLITQYGGRLPIMGIYWKDDDVYGDTLFANPYNLEIKNLSLGYNNEFTTKLNENAYVCNYKVTVGNDGSCVCPPGTEYSGYYLSGLIKDTAQTCAEAKEIYCNNICDKNPELCVCPSGSDYPGKDITECLKEPDYAACVADRCYNTPTKTCTKTDRSGEADITDCVKTNDIEYCKTLYGCKDSTNDIPCPPGSKYEDERNCNAWVNGGGTVADCIVNWCNDSSCTGDNCDPVCPSGSDYEGMSISDCVSSERGAGKNLTEALNICQKYCYKGGNIIYRTISLENPFVGKDASTNLWTSGGLMNWMHQVSGVDPSIGLAVYRYPGANWNSPTLVKNKIWYNRGYKASAIYQEATPLYTINLDAKAIKEIRKYNEAEQSKGGYADFELTCTDGAYCISNFLHSNTITTATGEPILDSKNSTCAKANDKSSFISCYTYK